MRREPLTQERAARLQQGVPEELRALPRFLPYVLRPRANGRLAKVPVRVLGAPCRAYPVDPLGTQAHLPFEDALAHVENGYADGLGLSLDERVPVVDGLPLIAVDLDHVIQEGKLVERARSLVEALDTYAEVSQSGLGLHLIGAARLPPTGRRGEGVELITIGYLALTGNRWPGTPSTVACREAPLRALHARLLTPTSVSSPRVPVSLDDQALLRQIRRARNAARFEALYDRGDLSSYGGDHSRADLALLRMLCWYTSDREQLWRLWRASALARTERWARRASADGRDYAAYTIDRAVALAARSLP